LTGGHDRGDDVLIGGAWGLYLLDGDNGSSLYNTGSAETVMQSGCDVSSNPAVSYVPGTPGKGWMLYFACGGPAIPAKLVAYPFPIAPAAYNPPAWPEWRANADRTGIADPLSVPRTSCGRARDPGSGSRLVTGDGTIFDLGGVAYCGALNSSVLPTGVAAIADTPSGGGYWLLLQDGSVYAFGDAKWYGDLRGGMWHGGPVPPGAPVVGIAPSPDGKGYFVVGADGSVYAFGDARYQGSRGGKSTDGAVVAIAVDRATGGYWLVTSRGAVYNFGAPYRGSAASRRLPAPVVAITSAPDGSGYWLAGATGAVYGYGVAQYGSAIHEHLSSPIVGIATDAAGKGYWLAEASGTILRFGHVPWYGQVSSRAHSEPITAFSAVS
jgi:ribosomal protein L24E